MGMVLGVVDGFMRFWGDLVHERALAKSGWCHYEVRVFWWQAAEFISVGDLVLESFGKNLVLEGRGSKALRGYDLG